MSNFEPKQGDMIYVWRRIGAIVQTREFMFKHKGYFYCIDSDSAVNRACGWEYAKPIPTNTEPLAYNHETWPKQVVWIKHVEWGINDAEMMIGFTDVGITIKENTLNFDILAAHYELSLDHCATWQPCHYVPESE